MKLPAGHIPLISPEFEVVLEAVHSFHDGSLAFIHFDDLGPMAFIDTMYFGEELFYNPKPVLGGVFWFDIGEGTELQDLKSRFDRGIGHIDFRRQDRTFEIQFQDPPFEKLEFKCGPNANFQFIASSPLNDAVLERRKTMPYFRPPNPHTDD